MARDGLAKVERGRISPWDPFDPDLSPVLFVFWVSSQSIMLLLFQTRHNSKFGTPFFNVLFIVTTPSPPQHDKKKFLPKTALRVNTTLNRRGPRLLANSNGLGQSIKIRRFKISRRIP